MRKALTAAAVERMRPPAKGQIEIFDRGYPGLLLRVSYGGGKAFAMFYRHGGKLKRLTLGWHPAMTLAEAREAWRDARRLVALGQDPGLKPIKTSDTVANVVAEWIKRDKRDARPSTIYQIERALRYDVLPRVGRPRYRLDHQARDPRAARRHRRSCTGHGAERARASCAACSAGPSGARSLPSIRWPASSARQGQQARPRLVRRRARQGVARRRAATPTAPMVKLLILTGARRERDHAAAMGRRSTTDTIELPAERTKTGRARIIPLSPQAAADSRRRHP